MLANVSILGVARILPIGLAFVQSTVVARVLGPEAFGAIALITAFPSLVFGILNVRTSETTSRYLAGFDAEHARVRALGLCKIAYAVDLAVATLAFAVVALTAFWVGPRILADASLIPLMIVFALSFVPNAFGPTSSSILAIADKFVLMGSIEVAGAILRTALVVGLVLAGYGIPSVIYGAVVGNALVGALMMATAHHVARRRWGLSWLRSSWADLSGQRREIARFFAFSDLNELVGVSVKHADVLILGMVRPTVEIGYYSLAKAITNHVLSLVSTVRVVAFPKVMRLWSLGEWDAMWAYVRSNMWAVSVPGTAAVGLLMLTVEPIITLVYGVEFVPAGFVTRVLLLQVVLLLLSLWIGMVFTSWGDVHVRLGARVAGAVLALSMIVLLSPRWGIAAAATALLCQQALSVFVVVAWVLAHRATREREAAGRLQMRLDNAAACAAEAK